MHAWLQQAAEARHQGDVLQGRLSSVNAQLDEQERRVAELREQLDDATEDVARLESFSWVRIVATLRGSQASDLEREKAERDAARYSVAEAEARRDVTSREAASLRAQLDDLGDVDSDYGAALAAVQQSMQAARGPGAERLVEITEKRGALAAEATEIGEAQAAGLAARDLLIHAEQLLRSARGWADWDTFAGGGFFTDMMKYDKIEQVSRVLHQADVALGTFSRELADVGRTEVAGVDVGTLTRTFDVWFDNLFADLEVRRRIRAAHERVSHVLDITTETIEALAARGQRVGAEIGSLDADRERVLLAGS